MKHILIIDDDKAQRQMFQTILTDAGYAVDTATDGERGIAMFREHDYDLVITDIFMPGKSGFDTIFDLKSHAPGVKIVAISGGATAAHGGERWNRYHGAFDAEDALNVAKQYGADCLLAKPVSIQRLVEMIGELLNVKDRRSYLERLDKSAPVESSAERQDRAHILVIDDDDDQRELFRVVLAEAGYRVTTAPDGHAGARLFQQQSFDLVITDIFMPHEDGIDTIVHLKSLSPSIKILAISGGGHWEPHGEFVGADRSLAMASRFGADRILHKPIRLQELQDLIEHLLAA